MALMAAREDDSDVSTTASVSVLVKQAGSAVAETLHHGLRDAGLHVVVVPTAYDVVVEAERAPGTVAHVVLGVDHLGPGEFRLMPLVRREWPETVVVAYHGPGFEYKGRIAELVGADIVLSTAEDVSRFLAGLTAHRTAGPAVPPPAPPAPLRMIPSPAPPQGPPTPAAPPPVPEPAPAAKPEPAEAASDTTASHPPPPAVATPAPPPPAAPAEPEPSHVESETPQEMVAKPPAASAAPSSTSPVIESYLAGAPTPENAPEPQPQTQGLPHDVENLDGDAELADGEVVGTVELTDDELHILLGEEGET